MKRNILKPVLGGVLFGAILFAIPFFIFKFLLFFFLFGALFRLLAWRRYRRYEGHFGRGFDPRWSDRIRTMSEEEYQSFKQQSQPIPSL
jgi:hypothetical protein